MKRTKWPSSAPVFEILNDGKFLPRGAVFEGVEPWCKGGEFPGLGGFVSDESQLIRIPPRHPTHGWCGIVVTLDGVKPLTPAAKEMLAIARSLS